MGEVDVSVIIISYNTLAYLQRSAQSVAGGFRRYAAEVIVVDNGSSDGSREWLQGQPRLRAVLNPANVGFAAANNQAIALRRGRHCMLLNSDAFLHPGCGDTLVDFLDGHPRAGLVVPTFEYEGGIWQPSCGDFPSLRSALAVLLGWRAIAHAYYRWRDRRPPPMRPSRQGYGEGAGLLIRDRVLEQIGGLAPAYYFYGEDAEYCMRAARAGWQTWWAPAARLTHVRGASLSRKDIAASAERQLLGVMRFMGEHYPPTMVRAAFVVMVLQHLKMVILGRLAARLPGAGGEIARRLPLYDAHYRLYRKYLGPRGYADLVARARCTNGR